VKKKCRFGKSTVDASFWLAYDLISNFGLEKKKFLEQCFSFWIRYEEFTRKKVSSDCEIIVVLEHAL